MADFKDRLAELFEKIDLSQKSASKETGISQGSLSEYLAGKKEPTIASVIKIAVAIGVSLNWLLLGEGEMFRDKHDRMAGEGLLIKEELLRLKSIPPEDIPKEKMKQWLDDFWRSTDPDTRTWLEVEFKRQFPEYLEWLQKHKEPEKD